VSEVSVTADEVDCSEVEDVEESCESDGVMSTRYVADFGRDFLTGFARLGFAVVGVSGSSSSSSSLMERVECEARSRWAGREHLTRLSFVERRVGLERLNLSESSSSSFAFPFVVTPSTSINGID